MGHAPTQAGLQTSSELSPEPWKESLFTDLPVAAAAPEYMEQKATIDAIFALALGLYTYVNPVPTVTGAPNLVKLLTKDCRKVTGGILNVEKDAVKAVDGIEQHIMEKRQKLGI